MSPMSEPVLELEPVREARLVAVDGRKFPLESAHLEARTEGGLAMSTLAQTFANPHGDPLEVLYTLPLPADGAVIGYTVSIGEKVIRAEVQPREKAEEEYRNALYEGRTAGLLAESRPDTFQQSLGNVPPGTKVEITIDVLHPLAFVCSAQAGIGGAHPEGHDHGAAAEWEYRFPTVVGVRYHGAPGRVPDQADLSPDRGEDGAIPARIELTLTVQGENWGNAGPRLRSPSHGIEWDAGNDGLVVRLRQGERLDRDVVVRWAAAGNEVGVRIVEGGGLEGDDGRYAIVTVVPPVGPKATFPRDLTILVDASGSMDGSPLELAKRVIVDLLRSLDKGDRFELLAFSNDVVRLTPGLHVADERSVERALEALRKLQAGGATDMARAIEKALEPVRADAQRQVVLVTDGYIGFEAEVIGRITAATNARLHAVGIGSAPNRSLTQQAAAAGRGLEVLVGDTGTAAEAALRLIAGTAQPVLTNLVVSGSALAADPPARLRDVFAQQPLVFAIELSPMGGTLELRGDLARGAWTTHLDVPSVGDVGALPRTTLPIGALYGRGAIAEAELGLAGPPYDFAPMLESRIEALGMRHRIASRRTSLVAIAEEPSVDPKAPRRRVRLPVEMPMGVSAEGAGVGRSHLPTLFGDGEVQMSALPMIDRRPLTKLPIHLEARLARVLRQAFGPPPGQNELTATNVRWLASDLLAIEFETPSEGLSVPAKSVGIAPADDAEEPGADSIEIDPKSSTRPGWAGGGKIIRLVIRVTTATHASAGQRFEIYWRGKRRSLVIVRFVMPGQVRSR